MRTAIICGCLPSQHNILSSDLYHEHLRTQLLEKKNVGLVILSEWYVRLCDSAQITEDLVTRENIELALYHVRPDPFLRMCKLFVRYKNAEGQVKYFFNSKANDSLVRDTDTATRSSPRKKIPVFKTVARNINYILGLFFGSYRAAAKKETAIISRLNSFGKEKKVKFIFIGPASRPRSIVENFLLLLLEKKLFRSFNSRVDYVTCYGNKDSNNEFLFSEDFVHLNPTGHKRMAELIYQKLSNDY